MKRFAALDWCVVSVPSSRRRQVLVVEPLEERWLLDGQVELGPLGGPLNMDRADIMSTPISVISLGSAIAAALLSGPPGCPRGGGRAPEQPGGPEARMLAGPQTPNAGLPALSPAVFQAEAALVMAQAAQTADDLAQSLAADPFRLDAAAL